MGKKYRCTSTIDPKVFVAGKVYEARESDGFIKAENSPGWIGKNGDGWCDINCCTSRFEEVKEDSQEPEIQDDLDSFEEDFLCCERTKQHKKLGFEKYKNLSRAGKAKKTKQVNEILQDKPEKIEVGDTVEFLEDEAWGKHLDNLHNYLAQIGCTSKVQSLRQSRNGIDCVDPVSLSGISYIWPVRSCKLIKKRQI